MFSELSYNKNNACQNRRFWDQQKCKKKVQKGPEAPKSTFSKGGGSILKVVGYILKVVGKL